MANICKICAYPDQETVKAAFAAGGSDRDIARQFGVSHTAVGRHRRAHVVAPMAAATRALDKGRTIRQDRAQQLAAIGQGDPIAIVAAMLGLRAQAEKLQRIEARLERMAELAEQGGSPGGVAAVAGQQLRGIETGAKLAGVGGYAPRREDAGAPAVFHLSINIPGREPPFVIDAVIPEAPPEAGEE